MKSKAFTTLELVLSLTLLAILIGLMALYNQGTAIRTDLRTQVALFAAELRLAQSNAAAGKDPGDFGIHLEETAYTVFEGATYDPEATSNRTIDLPEVLHIQNINIGGGSDIVFTAPKGETAQSGTVDFYSEAVDETVTLTISSLGYVSY